MTTVSVSELKAHLSRYLREVRRGGEVQVLDRGRPVAGLTGVSDAATSPQDEHRHG
jgi:prevent-host-death family protein